jgi:hypothetical protein
MLSHVLLCTACFLAIWKGSDATSEGAWAKCTVKTDSAASPLLGCATEGSNETMMPSAMSSEGAWAKCTVKTDSAASPLLGCATDGQDGEPGLLCQGKEGDSDLIVDLVKNAKSHLTFLKDVHRWSGDHLYTKSPTLACAVKRYKTMWIPLLKQMSKKSTSNSLSRVLVPPVDIAWIWHVHRLSSAAYDKFAQHHGLDTDGAFQLQSRPDISNKNAEATRRAWQQMHGDSAVPFFVDPSNLPTECSDVSYLDTADSVPAASFFVGGAGRQGKFLWNYLLPNFDEAEFMHQSAARYVRFVRLVGLHPSEPLVPSHPVDLMWHTHILSSHLKYNRDIQRLSGLSVLNHNDKAPEVELKDGFERTEQLWVSVYGSSQYKDYVIGDAKRGGLSRGPPPAAHWAGVIAAQPSKASHRASAMSSEGAWAKCTVKTDSAPSPLLGCATEGSNETMMPSAMSSNRTLAKCRGSADCYVYRARACSLGSSSPSM